MSSVADIAKGINKAWKTEVLTSGDIIPECKRFSMGTMSADYALYGGLPEGKLVVYAGESGSCKSLLACLGMAQYQKAHPDRTCIYVDAEETLRGQIDWFVKMTGLDLDPNKFLRYDCAGKSAEEIFDDIVKLQSADNIGMIIIDSAPMLLSQSDIDNDIAKDNGQRASIAKPMGKFLKFMIPAIAKADNTLLIINHTRIAGKTFTGANIYTEPCGYALNFYPSVKVRFAARKFTKGDKLDISASQVDSETDGLCATFSVTKNRLGALNRNGAKIVFRFESGLDTLTDLIEIITKYEIAKKLTSMTWQLVNPLNGEPYYDKETGEELKFTGKAKMVEYIKEHDEFRAEYEKAVSTYINHSKRDISLINEDELKAILEAEKGVEESINNTKEEEDVDTSSKEEKDEVE
jgi:recombination protein RecA